MNFKLEKDNHFLILMPYYNRPIEVKKALKSILTQNYKKWTLAFIDDGSDQPGEEIVKSVFNEEELKNVVFYRNNETKEDKTKRASEHSFLQGANDKNAGMFLNPFFNQAMKENIYDIAFFLCDDDMLFENYLKNLNYFYLNNPNVMYSYCDLVLFDYVNDQHTDTENNQHRLTKYGPMPGVFQLDTSQVSWRSVIQKQHNRYMHETFHAYFDAIWYDMLYKLYGLCNPNKIKGQYKRVDKEIWYDYENTIGKIQDWKSTY